MPREIVLAQIMGISRNTLRSVLTQLAEEKIIERMCPKGTIVCNRQVKTQQPLTFLLPCSDFLSETSSDTGAQSNRRMLRGVSQIAFEYNCRVETVPVSPTNNAHEIDWRKLDFINADSMVLINGYWYHDLFQMLLERKCRIALVNRQDFCLKQYGDFVNNSFLITVNAFGAAEAAVEHLFKQGCRRIALFHRYISEPEHSIMGGYLSGLRKCKLAFSAWHELPDGHMTLESIINQLKDLREKSGGFDGILIDPGTAYELRLHNIYQKLRLPPNVKIITSDDCGNGQWMTPQLTSMAFPYEDIGRIAAQHLLAPEFVSGEQLISARLIERESTSSFSKKVEFVSA